MPHVDCTSRSEVESIESTGRGRRLPAEAIFLLALAAVAFLVRLWPIWRVHFWDEAVYLQNAEVICCAKTNYSELSSRPPLLSLLFAGVFRLWHHVYAASIFTAALNAAGPLFLYLGGRKVVGRTGAAIAALLLAFAPYFVSSQTGNSLLSDSPALTLIVVSFWLLLETVDRDSGAWSGLGGFVSALAVLMRFASLPTVAILSLLLLCARRWFRAALWFGAGFVLGMGPYLLWSKLRYGGFLATFQTGWRYVGVRPEPATYYFLHFGAVFPWITLAGLMLWPVAWFLGKRHEQASANHEFVGDERRKVPAYLLWVWALVVLAYFSALPNKELRYILPLAPPLFLLAGQGLSLLLSPANIRARAAGAVFLGAVLAYSCAPDLARFRGPLISPFISEEKEVADFLEHQAPARAVLYTNYNHPVFAYYTHLPVHPLLEGAMFYDAFPEDMQADGYLLVYKYIDKDPPADWVESNPHFQRVREFPSLIVYRYHVQ